MIHICYALHDSTGHYSKFVAASMVSIFENTAEFVTTHIIIDNTVPKENLEKLRDVCLNYGQYIKFYNADELASERIEEIKQAVPRIARHWASVAAFYRLLIQNFVSDNVKKIIYLDADIIINRDINDYWSLDIKSLPLAAVPESFSGVEEINLKKFVPVKIGTVEWFDYFNAGFFILDLDQERKNSEDLLTRCLNFLKAHPDSTHLDQDALNAIFADLYFRLPESFNYLTNYARKLQGNRIEPKTYHYVVNSLQVDSKDVFNQLWFSYFIKTPFCTPRIFWDFRQTIDKYIVDYQRIADQKLKPIQHAFKFITERQRVFFIDPNDQKYIAENIGFDGSEIGLNAKSENAVEKLISQMKQSNSADSKSKRIFLIKLPAEEYDVVKKKLVAENFVENEDFVNVDDLFVAPVLDLPRSYRFVLQM